MQQNANGPCSLIALANVLILRGDVTVTPADRPVASFAYLSALLADHLLARAAERGAEAEADVAAALTTLPSTLTGLAVNVCFDACDAFAPLAAGPDGAGAGEGDGDGARALFQLAGVRLVHGWLPDAGDAQLLAAMRRGASDYDSAMMRIAQADSLASGSIFQAPPRPAPGGGGTPAQQQQQRRQQEADDEHQRRNGLSVDEQRQVDDGMYRCMLACPSGRADTQGLGDGQLWC